MSEANEVDGVVGKWCYLLDPRCKGQLVMALKVTRSGMRMVSAGVVPHDEYRLATEAEIEAWLARCLLTLAAWACPMTAVVRRLVNDRG